MPYQTIEELSEAECLQLIAPGVIGRIAYESRFGSAVLPVNSTFDGDAVLFRTVEHGPLNEDLRTGVTNGDYKVAFEIDDIDSAARRGWSVLIQGPAHHLTETERDAAAAADVETWRRARESCSSRSSLPHHRAQARRGLGWKRGSHVRRINKGEAGGGRHCRRGAASRCTAVGSSQSDSASARLFPSAGRQSG